MKEKHKGLIYNSSGLIILMALFLLLSFAASARVTLNQARTIDLGKFYAISMNEVAAGDVLNVDVQVNSGSPIDILLLKSSDYPEYENAVKQHGTFNYLAEGSTLATTSIKYSYRFKENGDYVLVIDNTDVPKGGGAPNGQVETTLKISTVTPAESQKSPGFEFLLAFIAILARVLLKK